MIEQTSTSIRFESFFTAAKQGKTGLTVTVDVYGPSGLTVSGGSATAEGGGFYSYPYSGLYTSLRGAYRAIFKTTDTTVDLQHIPSLWEIGVAGVENLDTSVSSRVRASTYVPVDNVSIVAAKTAAESVDAKLTIARAAKIDNLDATITSRLAATDYIVPTTPPSASVISSAVWAQTTRSLTDKAGFSLATPFPTVLGISDIQTALTNQGITQTRTAKLDNLDATITSRLAATDYVAGGGSGGAAVRLIQGPLHLYSDSAGSDDVVEATIGDAITLAVYLRDGNNEPIPYTSGTLTASLLDAFGAVSVASVAITEISPDFGIAQVSFTFSQRGRFKLSVKRHNGSTDIITFGPMAIHVCGHV